jgi:hypothetical protein
MSAAAAVKWRDFFRHVLRRSKRDRMLNDIIAFLRFSGKSSRTLRGR